MVEKLNSRISKLDNVKVKIITFINNIHLLYTIISINNTYFLLYYYSYYYHLLIIMLLFLLIIFTYYYYYNIDMFL